MGGTGNKNRVQRITIGIFVIAQDALAHWNRDARIHAPVVAITPGGGCVVGAGDGDREGRGGRGAVVVRVRVAEHVSCRLAVTECLHRWVQVVEGVGEGAIGAERQRAICA
ncbi:hypothetical protein D9M72_344220 [compost metagenome]